jgi:hypothetical protein
MILPGCVGAGDGVVWPTPGVIYGDGVVDGAFGLYVGTFVGGLNGIYGVVLNFISENVELGNCFTHYTRVA